MLLQYLSPPRLSISLLILISARHAYMHFYLSFSLSTDMNGTHGGAQQEKPVSLLSANADGALKSVSP